MMERDFTRQTELPEAIKKISPAGRMAFPEEVAAAIHFLCTPGASYIHGIGMIIDAGFSLTRGLA
jgi:NAD(P)-dependent dehydrogenase (short-subunit alcohol dehydrogenase family)